MPETEGGRPHPLPLHGGKTLIGNQLPQFKHGKFSKFMPPGLVEHIAGLAESDELLDCRDDIAIATAVIQERLTTAFDGDYPRLWEEMAACVAAYEKEARSESPSNDKLTGLLVRLFGLVRQGRNRNAAMDDVLRKIDQRTQLVARESRRQVEMSAVYTVAQVGQMFAVLTEQIRRYVKDPIALTQISEGFDSAFSGRSFAPITTGGQSTSNSVTPELYEPLEGSLRKFIPAAWPVLYPEADFIPGRHIDAIADHLEAGLRFEFDILVINVPPGFMKSTIGCVMFPAWAWANDPTLGFMYVSYHEKLSTRDSVRTRDLISSAWYQGGWRHRVRLKADQNEKKRFETDKGGVRQSSTVGGFGTGEHVDVPVRRRPTQRDRRSLARGDARNALWWDTSTAGRFKNPSRFLRVISAQRLSSLDLCAHVLDTGGKVCHLKIPMKYKPSDSYVTSTGWRDWRSAEDELAWPEFMSAEAVRSAEATLGPAGVAAQHQQAPIAEGGSFFRSEFFRYFAWETETPAAAETDVESRSRVRLKTPSPLTPRACSFSGSRTGDQTVLRRRMRRDPIL